MNQVNPLLKQVIENKRGHYCHCVEVSTAYELECIADEIINQELPVFDIDIITDFLSTMSVYCLDDGNEDEVFNFSFSEYIGANY